MAMSLENTGLELGVEVMLPLWKAQEEKSSKMLGIISVFMLVSSSIIMPDRLRLLDHSFLTFGYWISRKLLFRSFVSHF